MNAQEVANLRALMEYEAARTEPPRDFPNLPDIPAGLQVAPQLLGIPGTGEAPRKHVEELIFHALPVAQRNYKS